MCHLQYHDDSYTSFISVVLRSMYQKLDWGGGYFSAVFDAVSSPFNIPGVK